MDIKCIYCLQLAIFVVGKDSGSPGDWYQDIGVNFMRPTPPRPPTPPTPTPPVRISEPKKIKSRTKAVKRSKENWRYAGTMTAQTHDSYIEMKKGECMEPYVYKEAEDDYAPCEKNTKAREINNPQKGPIRHSAKYYSSYQQKEEKENEKENKGRDNNENKDDKEKDNNQHKENNDNKENKDNKNSKGNSNNSNKKTDPDKSSNDSDNLSKGDDISKENFTSQEMLKWSRDSSIDNKHVQAPPRRKAIPSWPTQPEGVDW